MWYFYCESAPMADSANSSQSHTSFSSSPAVLNACTSGTSTTWEPVRSAKYLALPSTY